MRIIAILGTSFLFGILCINNCEGSDSISAFADTPIVGKIMLARIVVHKPPTDVAEVIREGKISLVELRELAKSGTGQQRFWAIYCVGSMSQQMYDYDFLAKLEQSKSWNEELPIDEAIWIRQILEDARQSIGSRADKKIKR